MPSANQKTKSTLNSAKLDRLRASNFAARDVPGDELGAVLRQLAEAGAGASANANVGANAAPTAEDARDQQVAETFIDAVESGIEVVRTASAELARSAAFESDSESDKILTNILGEVKSLGARIMSAFSGTLRDTTALDAGAASTTSTSSARALPNTGGATNASAPKGQFLQGGMASKAGQIGIGLLGGLTSALGGDKVAERVIQRIVDRESFIEHETKQRSESQPEFRQLDSKAQRKVLSDEYKRTQAKNAAPAESTEDFLPDSTPSRQERGVISNDVSNSGSEPRSERGASGDEELDQEDKLRHSAEMSVQAEHTTLLAEIADILRNKTFGTGSGNSTGSTDSLSLPDFGLPRPAPAGGRPPTPRPADSGGARPPSGATTGSKALSFGKGLLQRAAAPLAVAGGVYEGYTAFSEAGSKKADSLASIDQAEQSGEITKREADIKRAEVESQSTEDKSGAVGKGVGVAAGALLGAKAGALAGSFIPIPGVGTVAGGLIGGIGGAIAGSSVGQNIGGALGRGYENVKSALGFGAPSVVPEASGVVGVASNPELGSAAQVITPPSAPTTNSASKPELAFQVTGKGASSAGATLLDTTPESALNAESATASATAAKSAGMHQRIAHLDNKDMAQMPRHNTETLREASLAAPTVKAPNIVVQAPAPVVIPSAPQTHVINPPFFNNIRNHEASLSDYLRSRYG